MPRQALIQVRKDTAANWTSTNPTLASGEFGFETDTGKTKIGDGSTAWASLKYTTDGSLITSSTVTTTQLATSLQNLLVPAGTISATIRTTADTGWILLDGSTVTGASASYPSLWAVAPASWKSGTSLILPNMANRMLEGQSTTSLGATGGSNTVTIASGNLPTHTHEIDPPNTAVSISDPGHYHTPSGYSYFVAQSAYDGTNKSVSVSGTSLSAYNASATTTNTTGITASVNIASFTSGNGGFANTALTVTNAHLAVNYQIKAH